MKCTVFLAATVVLLVCVLFVGCTSPTEARIKPPGTPVTMQTQITPSPSAATTISTPQVVETLPYAQNVGIQVEKQRPDASIHLLFTGGQGEAYVQNIMMRVTRSDGTFEEKYMNDGTVKPRRYDELVMDGTKGVDQVSVFITSLGKTYKVYDSPLPYPQF
jgi:hypothetical protein